MLAQPLKLLPLCKAIFEVFLGIECPSLFRAGKHSDSTTLESFSFFFPIFVTQQSFSYMQYYLLNSVALIRGDLFQCAFIQGSSGLQE